MKNHQEDLQVDSTKKLILFAALIYILLTLPTFFVHGKDASWIVTLISQSLRMSIWVILAWLFLPELKEIYILVLCAMLFNIPASIADIAYVDKYDDLFIFIRLCFLLPALYLTIKQLVNKQ